MQRVRLKLLRDLEKDFDVARGYVKAKEVSAKQKQAWMRIMTYIAQVMNSVTQTFDEAGVTKELERLEKMVNEAVAADKDRADRPSS
jgi:ArsR family metal-binding transcriptional regulator